MSNLFDFLFAIEDWEAYIILKSKEGERHEEIIDALTLSMYIFLLLAWFIFIKTITDFKKTLLVKIAIIRWLRKLVAKSLTIG